MAANIEIDYYLYLLDLINGKSFNVSKYEQLLSCLHNTEFVWIIPNDSNRASDGIDLRKKFKDEERISDKKYDELMIFFEEQFEDPNACTVLEMMVGLAKRCEEHIMENSDLGNRTGKWFKIMIESLGLDQMNNVKYNEEYVGVVLSRFLNRSFKKNGEGSLFVISKSSVDMRKLEIWYQMSSYLDEILDL